MVPLRVKKPSSPVHQVGPSDEATSGHQQSHQMLDFKDIESFRAPSDTMKDYVQSERREKYMQMEQKKLEVEAFKRQREVELHESAIMREQLQDQFKKWACSSRKTSS